MLYRIISSFALILFLNIAKSFDELIIENWAMNLQQKA